MTKAKKKIFESKLEDAKERVVRAAVKYVNFEDGGTISDLNQLTRIQIKMADAVTRLQNVKKNYRVAKGAK